MLDRAYPGNKVASCICKEREEIEKCKKNDNLGDKYIFQLIFSARNIYACVAMK